MGNHYGRVFADHSLGVKILYRWHVKASDYPAAGLSRFDKGHSQ